MQVALAVSNEELTPEAPKNVDVELRMLVSRSCQHVAMLRPAFGELVGELRGAMDALRQKHVRPWDEQRGRVWV
jgi:hypothetical protein